MDGEPITVEDLAEAMAVTKRTVWNRIKEHGGFTLTKNNETKASIVIRKEDE